MATYNMDSDQGNVGMAVAMSIAANSKSAAAASANMVMVGTPMLCVLGGILSKGFQDQTAEQPDTVKHPIEFSTADNVLLAALIMARCTNGLAEVGNNGVATEFSPRNIMIAFSDFAKLRGYDVTAVVHDRIYTGIVAAIEEKLKTLN